MKLVMDLLFADSFEFRLADADARRCMSTTRSMGEAFKMACALIGIELVDYEHVRFQSYPGTGVTVVTGHSRLWAERIRRGAA